MAKYLTNSTFAPSKYVTLRIWKAFRLRASSVLAMGRDHTVATTTVVATYDLRSEACIHSGNQCPLQVLLLLSLLLLEPYNVLCRLCLYIIILLALQIW